MSEQKFPKFRRTPKDVEILQAKLERERTRNRSNARLKLNYEVIENIYQALSTGHYPAFAAAKVGISPETLYEWIRKGRGDFQRLSKLEREGIPLREEDYSIYFDLYVKVQRALFEVQEGPLTRIQEASEEDWRAAAHFLERRFPKEWGKKSEKTNVEITNTTTPQTVIVVPKKAESIEEWNKMVEERKKEKELEVKVVEEKPIPGISE